MRKRIALRASSDLERKPVDVTPSPGRRSLAWQPVWDAAMSPVPVWSSCGALWERGCHVVVRNWRTVEMRSGWGHWEARAARYKNSNSRRWVGRTFLQRFARMESHIIIRYRQSKLNRPSVYFIFFYRYLYVRASNKTLLFIINYYSEHVLRASIAFQLETD